MTRPLWETGAIGAISLYKDHICLPEECAFGTAFSTTRTRSTGGTEAPKSAHVRSREWNVQRYLISQHDHVFDCEVKIRESSAPALHGLYS